MQVAVTGRKFTRMIKVTRRILQPVSKKGEIFSWRRRKGFFSLFLSIWRNMQRVLEPKS